MSKIIDQNVLDSILSALRGFRNGIITGVRIRIPYVFQSVIYALSDGIVMKGLNTERSRFTIKQMFHHGKNLGLFVLIYKSICSSFRYFGIKGGIESWVAGAVGGYYAFGESKGVSGAVNNQIVLYLFARGIEGLLLLAVKRKVLPESLDVRKPQGFRLLAGFSLALILYLTEYQPETLRAGFMQTMDVLYYESNKGPLSISPNFIIFVVVILISLSSIFYQQLSLDNMLETVFREKKAPKS